MSRDKQIEDMARDICHLPRTCDECEICAINGYICQAKKYAERAVDKGYVKASDVAREIFEEIEKLMNKLDKRHIACGNPKQAWGIRSAMTELAELKKKYESEVK
jgi:sulfatase maturation enzyme AslB (radical SAM superfamily)